MMMIEMMSERQGAMVLQLFPARCFPLQEQAFKRGKDEER